MSRDFRSFFFLNIRPGPHRDRQTRFLEIFRFSEDIRSQSSKIVRFLRIFRENKTFRETVFACSDGARWSFLKNNLVTLYMVRLVTRFLRSCFFITPTHLSSLCVHNQNGCCYTLRISPQHVNAMSK